MHMSLGKGVMSKDGKTPFAAGTLHYKNEDGWMFPADFTPGNVLVLLADPKVTEIRVITKDNDEYVLGILR